MKIAADKIKIKGLDFSLVVKSTIFFIFLYLIVELKELVLVFLVAIILASVLEPFIKKMESFKIPRLLSVSFIYLFLIGAIFWSFVLIIPSIIDQINNFLKEIPFFIENIDIWLNNDIFQSEIMKEAVQQVRNNISNFTLNISEISSNNEIIKNNIKIFSGLVVNIFGGLLNFLLALVFSFYLAIQNQGIDDFLRTIVPVKHEKYILGLWRRTQKKISLWMQGQLILALVIGVLTYLGLVIFFDFKQALVLAIIAAFAELIPVVGVFIAAIPAIIIGFINGGWTLVGLVIIMYLVIQLIESQFIYPLVIKKIVGVPSILVIFSLIIGANLFGFLGVFLAIPIAAAFLEYYKDVEKKQLERIRIKEEEEKLSQECLKN